jgi:hypothetical protein
MAWLQINSAKELRPEEPDVLRMLGQIEATMGRATALDYYEKLSQKSEPTRTISRRGPKSLHVSATGSNLPKGSTRWRTRAKPRKPANCAPRASCGRCPGEGGDKKDRAMTEEGSQS